MSTRVDRMIERARAPLSALRPVVPSAFSPGPLLRDDVQESPIGSANSPNIPGIYGSSFGDVSASTLSKLAPEDAADSRILEAPPAAQESPRFKPGSFPDSGAPVSHSEPKMPGDRQSFTPPSDSPQSRISKASSPSDPPSVSSAASSSVLEPTQKNEADATRRTQELATSSARTKQTDAIPPSATDSPESLIEVNVSIGSIDFRSARPAAPVKRSEAHPHVTLDSYLQRGKRDAR